ncbi:MAG TPA: NUDIX hydrolase, partial [Acetobacteraceae bacterium]|nr:NUDIX hydrolase [Acetobacteraceae bacterium]
MRAHDPGPGADAAAAQRARPGDDVADTDAHPAARLAARPDGIAANRVDPRRQTRHAAPMPDFVRRIPDGDNRERLICPDCGHIAYDNPKIVVGSVVAT